MSGPDHRKEVRVDPQRIARVFGILFLLTWVTAIAGRVLLEPIYSDPRYVLGGAADTGVYLGAVFEFLLIVTNVGTAVVLYPIAKRHSEIGAVGYVTARLVECAFILVGLLSLLTVVTLRQDLAGATGADAASLVTAGRSLTAVYDWTFLFGPGLMAGVGNGLVLGYVMYRSGLVPRRLAVLGLAGGSLHVIGFLGVLLGAFEAGSPWQFLFSMGEMAWEASLPIYVIWKGFKPSAVTSGEPRRMEMDPTFSAATA
jgi:hypothetical protein